MALNLHYDAVADAAYLRFSDEPVEDSQEVMPGVVFDFDASGKVVALEVMQARDRLPKDALDNAA